MENGPLAYKEKKQYVSWSCFRNLSDCRGKKGKHIYVTYRRYQLKGDVTISSLVCIRGIEGVHNSGSWCSLYIKIVGVRYIYRRKN